jgi:hypothetical protein
MFLGSKVRPVRKALIFNFVCFALLSVVCYFVRYVYYPVLCLILVLQPPGINLFAVQIIIIIIIIINMDLYVPSPICLRGILLSTGTNLPYT